MSNFIPFMSSTPPPIDDEGDGDDDFNGFVGIAPSAILLEASSLPTEADGVAQSESAHHESNSTKFTESNRNDSLEESRHAKSSLSDEFLFEDNNSLRTSPKPLCLQEFYSQKQTDTNSPTFCDTSHPSSLNVPTVDLNVEIRNSLVNSCTLIANNYDIELLNNNGEINSTLNKSEDSKEENGSVNDSVEHSDQEVDKEEFDDSERHDHCCESVYQEPELLVFRPPSFSEDTGENLNEQIASDEVNDTEDKANNISDPCGGYNALDHQTTVSDDSKVMHIENFVICASEEVNVDEQRSSALSLPLFNEVSANPVLALNLVEESESNVNTEDDFADFKEAVSFSKPDNQSQSDITVVQTVHVASIPDGSDTLETAWASFDRLDFPSMEINLKSDLHEHSQLSPNVLEHKNIELDEDEFGEFNDDVITPSYPATISTTGQQMISSKENNVGSIIMSSFAYPDDSFDSASIQGICDENVDFKFKVNSRFSDIGIYEDLCNVETSKAFHFLWTDSLSYQLLLKASSIDTRNMLVGHKKQSVPIFATQLGLLEPSRGTMSLNDEQTVEVKSKKVFSLDSSGLDMPAVDFDWSSSGLTNPFDAVNNMQLDLDFFIKDNPPYFTGANSPSEAVQKEQEILDALEPTPLPNQTTLQPLQNILAKFVPTTPSANVDKKFLHLSDEAEKIIKNLPDLSFMHANVLMFPVRQAVE